ncbi:hypothetical protein [Ezakiella peruensis]|uniref:hypothetical protein n=1 Tax=Ezakiella peruensis TaxID=1464038 RepID=UPI000C1B1DE5|nr:hypothetical protein [Ezakiella peruensis]
MNTFDKDNLTVYTETEPQDYGPLDINTIKTDLAEEIQDLYLTEKEGFFKKHFKRIANLIHHAKEEALEDVMKDLFNDKNEGTIDEVITIASNINVLLDFKYRFVNFGSFFAPIWKFLFPFFLSFGAVLLTVRSIKDLDVRSLFGISIATFVLIVLVIIAVALSMAFFIIKTRHKRMFAIYINERLEYIIHSEFLRGNLVDSRRKTKNMKGDKK